MRPHLDLRCGRIGGKCSLTQGSVNSLRITNKKNFISFTYHINDCSIQEVTHAKYLGVVLDQHLSWNDHIKKIASKATKVIGFLQRNLYQCPPLVKSRPQPIMLNFLPIMLLSSAQRNNQLCSILCS